MNSKETRLEHKPADRADATVSFIGKVTSEWCVGNCPKNLTDARARKNRAHFLTLVPEYRAALSGLRKGDHIWLMLWFDRADRELLVQAPRAGDDIRGVFSLRSPARPNPISLHLVQIVALDIKNGVVEVDAIDAFDETPVLDIKPWRPGIDRID